MSRHIFDLNTPASGNDQKWERIERKFFVSPEKTFLVRNLLAQTCLKDKLYHRGVINSLYFDTPDLDHYWKSDDGDYGRHKIRIRWYDSPPDACRTFPVYLELKSKNGFASSKQRRKILVPADRVNTVRIDNTIINMDIILRTLTEFGYFPEDRLHPVILISYERFRFVEILTDARLSFDFKIRSTLAAMHLGYSRKSLMLAGGVVEIKGLRMEIPHSLRTLNSIGIDWTRFSKYASCVESQQGIPGSMGSLWPSGRISLL